MHINGRGHPSLYYLHGDADEEEEIKFEQADDNLVPSVHCYRGIVSDHIETYRDADNEDCLLFMIGLAPTMWKTAQLSNNMVLISGHQGEDRIETYPNSSNSTLVHHKRLNQAAAMTHGAAISNGRTLTKRVPAPAHP
jgi:hypothetical protein